MDLLTGAAEPAPTPPAPPALLAPSALSLTSTFGSSAQVSFLNIAFTGLPLSYYDVQKFRHETMNLPGTAPAAPESAQPPKLKSATNAASSLFGNMRKQIAASTQNIAFKALAHTTSSSFKDTILATVTLTTTSSSNSSVTLEPISLNPEFSQTYNLYKTCIAVPPSCTDISIKLTLSSGAGKSAGALGSAIAGVDFPLGSIELDSSKIAELTSSQEVLKEFVIGEGSDYWKEKGEVHARLLNPPSTIKPGQPGWSLTDPTPESPNITSTFCFNSLEKEQTIFTENDVVVAVERSRESTIVLPVAAAVSRLLSEGAATSSAHSWLLAQAVRRRNGIFVDKEDAIENNHAACCAKISGFTRNWADGEVSVKNPDSGSCIVRISLQPLGCVFAKELLSFETSIYNSHGHATSNFPHVDVDFFPHVEFNSHNEHNRVQLGSLRFEVTWGKGSFAEGVLPLDSWVSKCAQNDGTCSNIRVKLSDVHRKAEAGTINLDLSIVVGDASNKRDISGSVLPNPITGLVNMVNLGHLGSTQLDKPVAVCEQPGPIGDLLQSDWLEEHAQQRAQDSSLFSKYASTFKNYTPTEDEAGLHSSKRRYPSNFKPSAAKADKNLTPIAINVHNQTFSMQTVDGQEHPRQLKRFLYTTCGAPCDHGRGFGVVKGTSTIGGLRKLESKRKVLAEKAQMSRLELLRSVKETQDRHPTRSHIPNSELSVHKLREMVIEKEQQLVSLTWECAMRRSAALSQALAICLTSYLACVSDPVRCSEFASKWLEHGFLVSFEGMLSAAGKEIHMIEDASVGIEMIRDCEVVLETVKDEFGVGRDSDVNARSVEVDGSEWIKNISVSTRTINNVSRIRVHVKIDSEVYEENIPECLKGEGCVRFYPVLFQMGVDIKQWGKNLVKSSGRGAGKPGQGAASVPNYEEEGGVIDSDLLTNLNHEAFQKLNKYAHKFDDFGYAGVKGDGEIPIHVTLGKLWDFVSAGAKKIEHGVLDVAGECTVGMGGGCVVYCKSGKDRTGMGVTLREAQFLKEMGRGGDDVKEDAYVLRRFGTRIAICKKNIGKWSYAFNTLQSKFMPVLLKPPHEVLAALWDKEKVET